VHPNEKGCQKLADLVAAKIKSPVSVAAIKDRKIKKRKK
jgi:lysophospholipase L1-like esterase